ncbi:Acetyltransferase (GNAT) domain protein [Candidatus Burarchaeum australiense]|nr:Acetyltransferase (GNAT) domain protein [Candidatus Burarchaeum australiense]
MKLEVKRAIYAKDKDAIHDIRTRVFMLELSVTLEEELDGLDESAMHVIAYANGRPVGTARLVELENGGGKIGRMAMLKEYRKKGAGTLMLKKLVEMARAMGMRGLETDARVKALPFYEALGFVPEGPVFMDARMEHRKMRMKL